MRIKQISVFLQNVPGRVNQVLKILGDNGVNIRGIMMPDAAEWGILRLLVSDEDKAAGILKENGFAIDVVEVLSYVVPNSPGTLFKEVLEPLSKAGINLVYMYGFFDTQAEVAKVVFRTDNLEEAAKILGIS